jgi:magnesium-transporting ATPase (P-type)
MVVCSVGQKTIEEKKREGEDDEDELTPLQIKLNNVANDISVLGLCAALIVVIVLYLRFGLSVGLGILEWKPDDGPSMVVEFFIIGITLLMVAVPEGLPLAVSIALAYSVLKMLKENNMVKQLQSCEIMGIADSIITDKTGTVTTNKMEVNRMWVDRKQFTAEINLDNRKIDVIDLYDPACFSYDYFSLLEEAICVNSTAFIIEQTDNSGNLTKVGKGSKTEVALLKFLAKRNGGKASYESIRALYNTKPVYKVYDFSCVRKVSSVVISLDQRGKRKRIYVKGAAEVLVDRCTHFLSTE